LRVFFLFPVHVDWKITFERRCWNAREHRKGNKPHLERREKKGDERP
jgi:hypothetical protein